jgi:thioredoxin-like negative regulator of GroEL
MIVSTVPSNTPWEGTLDLRVENSDNPLKELRNLVKVHDAYERAASGQELLAKGDIDRGAKEFSKALSLAPEYSELKLWLALGMMRRGEVKKAGPVMRSALGRGHDLKAMLKELAARGIIPDTAKSRRKR